MKNRPRTLSRGGNANRNQPKDSETNSRLISLFAPSPGQGLLSSAWRTAFCRSSSSGLVRLEKCATTLPWRSTTYL